MESYQEKIWCPECEHEQTANVEMTFPWHTRIHDCENCGYLIMESEWNLVEPNTIDQ